MENEIHYLRMDVVKFLDWAKQNQESSQKSFSILAENFNMLLKLLISKEGAENLNLHHSAIITKDVEALISKNGAENLNLRQFAITSACENVEVENITKSDLKSLSSVPYNVFNDFSDDEDLEESLRIHPISLSTLSLNIEKLTDETTNETMENTKSVLIIDGSEPVKFSGKRFEQNLRALRGKYNDVCKKLPNAMKLPDSYLEYGAARGWTMKKIRNKFRKERNSVERMPTLNIMKKAWSKKEDIHKDPRSSPILNLTPEQFKAKVKALQQEYSRKKSNRRLTVPDFYFQFGAARGWTLKQIIKKFYVRRSDLNRMKSI